jgi:hypothetical protein
MRFLEMGLAFAAFGFVVANTVISLCVILYWRTVRPDRRRSGSLFVLRMLPAAASTGLVLGLLVPAYGLFEPRVTAEKAGPALFACIILALGLIGAGLYRAGMSWLATRRLERMWTSASVGSVRLGIPVRSYRVPSELPLAALVGVVRPRLFVSGQFLDALSENERQAVLQHEAGHLRSLDNLKRTAMKLAPDWLSLSPVGNEIEAAWAVVAEEEADDHAVGPDRTLSLDLAGALLKAVRLTPVRCAPASNFYDGATVARRVARLLKDRPAGGRQAAGRLAPRFAGILALLVAVAVFSGPALKVAYAMTEAAIRLLQ